MDDPIQQGNPMDEIVIGTVRHVTGVSPAMWMNLLSWLGITPGGGSTGPGGGLSGTGGGVFGPISGGNAGGGSTGGSSGSGGQSSDPCNPNGAPVSVGLPYLASRITALETKLQQDPWYLIPCIFASQFYTLGNFQVPQVTINKLNALNSPYAAVDIYDAFVLQNINDATSSVVNCDYFPVHITSLPTIGGVQWTPEQVFDYFRRNINKFTDNSIATFHPYVDGFVDETNYWNSNNYFNTILHLDMFPFDGSVIVSDVFSDPGVASSFTVTTIKSPWDNLHPVSGNRKFGIIQDLNGGYSIYTTAVDRVTKKINEDIGDIIEDFGGNNGLETADDLWRAFQTNMIEFINHPSTFMNDPTAIPGSASLYQLPEIILRPDYNYVKDYLTGRKTLEELRQSMGCP
jgi:hypothetical protein